MPAYQALATFKHLNDLLSMPLVLCTQGKYTEGDWGIRDG